MQHWEDYGKGVTEERSGYFETTWMREGSAFVC